MIDEEVNKKISQLLNNGFSFEEHKTRQERDELEADLVIWYGKNGLRSFVEEEMVYIVDSGFEHIMMLEITKNSIYFNPQEHIHLLEAVVVTLEFITEKLSSPEETVPIISNIEDDPTEEIPKPKPSFDFL
ncbi:hypothetical protein N8467_00575 [bacterium]|nr:hypothetical protein [bacterium]